MSKNINENEDVSVNPDVMAGIIHDYYNTGIKLAATTVKNYLENIMNSREDAIKLCEGMINDANRTIEEIHERLGIDGCEDVFCNQEGDLDMKSKELWIETKLNDINDS